MSQFSGKLTRYDPKNLRFRKAYIRERLAEIKHEREHLGTEREALDVALKAVADDPTGSAIIPQYAGDNPRFRKAYIRDRMENLKEEREILVAERTRIDDDLVSQADERTTGGIDLPGEETLQGRSIGTSTMHLQ